MSTAALASTEVKTASGDSVSVVTIGHASLLFTYQGHYVYVDPWNQMGDYATLPKADVILITHAHFDHLDAAAVAAIRTPSAIVISTAEVAGTLEGVKVLANGETADPAAYLKVLAVPAYNLPGNEHFHPKGRDNGYILTFGGTTFYVAGDCEPNPDLLAIKADVIFLPVNQPYTMTVPQAVQAAKAIQPKIFYPYHYAETEIEPVKTILAKEAPSIDVRLPPQKRLGQ
jgi:L-ascorbate metabolism protein UlaG (beta-lactamase superfamily)